MRANKEKKKVRESKKKERWKGKKRGERRRKSQGRYEPKSLRFAGAFPFEHAGGRAITSHTYGFGIYC
jgi:hypothetical protein